MTVKDCGHHGDEKREKLKKILVVILLIIFILGLIVLITWAVLKPTKPKFILQDATVYGFNLTAPTLLTSVFQVTVQARNSNHKLGIFYDRLITYATYHDQQITLPTGIPPTYQESGGMNIWSPFLTGQSVPIAPYIGAQINQDRMIGGVQLMIKMDGRVRFKAGTFTSATYRIHVSCQAVIPFGDSGAGVYLGNNAVKYQLVQSCSVSV